VVELVTKIGLIGGSGFYDLETTDEKHTVNTPFGDAKVHITDYGGKKVAFITRHGPNHSIPPHLVNYRANIYALYSLGVDRIISTSAVGSLLKAVKPGTFVIPDQFIDFTIGRPKTFFDGSFKVVLHSGIEKGGVVHADLSTPYCSDIRRSIQAQGKSLKIPIMDGGVYVCTEGPRFETPAEINAFKVLGGTLVGMTSVSECVLARELGMCYSTICLVTNYAAGMQKTITAEEVYKEFSANQSLLRSLLEKTLSDINQTQDSCMCSNV